jgi:hypothetical protein
MTGIDFYKSYFFYNRNGAANTVKVFAGDVIPEGTLVDMGTVLSTAVPGTPRRTFVANPLPMQRVLAGTTGDVYNLFGSGFTAGPPGPTGDAIEHYTGTAWLNAFNVGSWIGTISSLDPGVGYEISDMTAGADWNWTFTVGTDVLATEQSSKTNRVSSHK